MILPMPSCTLYKLTWVACTAALCTTAFLFAGANSQQGVPKSPASSATEAPVYFPPDMVDGFNGFFSHYLSRFGEPSLLAAAQDSSALSYRLDWMASQRWVVLAVRLSFNADGTASVTSIVESGPPAVLHRTQNSVSVEDAKKFMQMLEKAGFWAMPSMEQEKPPKVPRPTNSTQARGFSRECATAATMSYLVFHQSRAHSRRWCASSQGISRSSMSPSFPCTLESN